MFRKISVEKLKNPPLKFLGLVVLLGSVAINVVIFFDKKGEISAAGADLLRLFSYTTLVLGGLIIMIDFAAEYLTGRNMDFWADTYDKLKKNSGKKKE